MVYNQQSVDNETMPQLVPSAGFTPPCDYSAFAADSFDLSLLPGGETDLPLSPSTQLYTQSPPPALEKPKIYTSYYPNSPENFQTDLAPDFQKLLAPEDKSSSPNHLEVPVNNLYPASPVGSSYCSTPEHQLYQQNLISPQYPSSPETYSLYPSSPQLNNNSVYSIFPGSPQNLNQFVKKEEPSFTEFQIKEEGFLSPCSQASSPTSCSSYSNHSSPAVSNQILNEVFMESSFLDKQIKQESTVDFSELLQNLNSLKDILDNDFKKTEPAKEEDKPKIQDHQLLRQVLKDTSFQKKYNLKPIDFGLGTGFVGQSVKMAEPEVEGELISQEKIEPVISLAMEQMKKDVNNTCNALGISQDPSQWSSEHVRAWIQWTGQQFNLTSIQLDMFDLPGAELILLTEEDFIQRASQSGSILHAQLEIWKAACLEDLSMNWSSVPNGANSADISDDDEEEPPNQSTNSSTKPTSSRSGTGSSHIHLWQFLKELLASPSVHGSCIRWLDRGKGVFKIEDSVKVAKLWGKRKNRPAMNYDKLSRSIRQYYKKGIMKKTERSQRLVYQFCHPYSL